MITSIKKRKLVSDISANTIQTLATQLFGLLIFYFTSRFLPKNEFGELNWLVALLSTCLIIVSLGIDLVFVKRVAAGLSALTITRVHLFHTLATTLLLALLGLVLKFVAPGFANNHPFYFFVFLYLALGNVASSFRLGLTGLEEYGNLGRLAVYTNVARFLGILLLYFFGRFNLLGVIAIYFLAALFETGLAYYFISTKHKRFIVPLFAPRPYKELLRESLPQLGVVLFDSALARIDWILLGVLSTAAATAEYSFSYRVFEISKLPVLIIAPVLLTRVSALLAGGEIIANRRAQLSFFFKFGLIVVMFIPILLVCVWSPLVDYLTNGKYGTVNETTYRILAICVPLHGIINFLWTLAFVRGKLKALFFVTIATSVCNIGGNLVLIPVSGAHGAAVTFLVSTLLQLVLYILFLKTNDVEIKPFSILLVFGYAFFSVIMAKWFFGNAAFSAAFALAVYITLVIVTRQLQLKEVTGIILQGKR